MVQVTPDVHTPWKLGTILVLLLVLGAGVGFWWFVSSNNSEHEARIAAIDRQAVLGLFDTAFYTGDIDRAVTQALIISETYPTDPIGSMYGATAHAQAAMVRFDEQVRLPVVQDALEHAARLAPVQSEILRLLGYMHSLLNSDEASLAAFTEAVVAHPAPALALASRGQIHLKHGRVEEAHADFNAALAQDAGQATALLGTAELLLRTGEGSDAIASYTEQVFAATSNRLLYARALAVQGAAAYAEGRYDVALTTFYDALEYDEQQYDAQLGVLMSELALAITASLPHQSAIEAMHDTADAVERTYSGSAQLAIARGLLAALDNQPRDRRVAYDQALTLLSTDRSLALGDADVLREQLTASLNSNELFVPRFFLSTRSPIEHCVQCGQ